MVPHLPSAITTSLPRYGCLLAVAVGLAGNTPDLSAADGADVVGYSVIKGQFLVQTNRTDLILDPDFGYSVLASVDLADFDLLTDATLRLPDGESIPMDNLGDTWTWLDSAGTLEELNDAYVPGDYVLLFESDDGEFSCLVSLPEVPLPPTPRVTNFDDVQLVDASKPLTLVWDFDAPPKADDFLQVYVNIGHSEIFSTPNIGEPGALHGQSRSVTLPPDTLVPGFVHSVNVELTRMVSTNADCHPGAQGIGAVFRSTELEVTALFPPRLRMLSPSTNGVPALAVETYPERTVVLQTSSDLRQWANLATNQAPSGTNVFPLTIDLTQSRFFRAWQAPPTPSPVPAAIQGLSQTR